MAKRKKTAAPPPMRKRDVETATVFKVPPTVFRPPKIVIVGVEGWGKTSIASHVPDVGILMPSVETGYLTLMGAGRVPEVPVLVTDKWKDTLNALDNLGDLKALALDELSGFEKQCHEWVCRNEYGGDWSKFWAYHRGLKVAGPEWVKFLSKLEQLDIMIIAMSHCSIETFKDPMSDDHDRYVAALNKTTWGLTRRWADACLFGTFRSIVDDDGKGIGGDDRVLYTEHRDTHDAKNRFGMDSEIEIPEDPAETWPAIWDQIISEDE